MFNRKEHKSDEHPASSMKQGLRWWAKLIWGGLITFLLIGIVTTGVNVWRLLPHDPPVAKAIAEVDRYPGQSALLWGLSCARAGIDVAPSDKVQTAQRKDVLSKCLSPEYQPDIASAQYDPADKLKKYAPMGLQAIQPVSITPSDAHHAVALYLVYLNGGRQRYYSASIFADDAKHFLMEGIPHPEPAPADFATPTQPPESDTSLAKAMGPRLNNFFTAYFTANDDAMSGLSVDGKTFISPPNDFPAGVSAYRGITKVIARPLGSGKFEAVVTVRLKDAVTKIISVSPYRVVLVRAADGRLGDTDARYLVDSLSRTSTS